MEEQVVNQKSYNPFKMWGSWIGFIVFFFIYSFYWARIIDLESFKWILITNPIAFWELSVCNDAGCGWVSFISTPIIYFFYGWAIHSLIRKYKK